MFAERGRRVLAVDMDPQSNLTSGLGFNPYSLSHTVADAILEPDQSVGEAHVGFVDIVDTPGWSTTFRVFLPLRTADVATIRSA